MIMVNVKKGFEVYRWLFDWLINLLLLLIEFEGLVILSSLDGYVRLLLLFSSSCFCVRVFWNILVNVNRYNRSVSYTHLDVYKRQITYVYVDVCILLVVYFRQCYLFLF